MPCKMCRLVAQKSSLHNQGKLTLKYVRIHALRKAHEELCQMHLGIGRRSVWRLSLSVRPVCAGSFVACWQTVSIHCQVWSSLHEQLD